MAGTVLARRTSRHLAGIASRGGKGMDDLDWGPVGCRDSILRLRAAGGPARAGDGRDDRPPLRTVLEPVDPSNRRRAAPHHRRR